MSKSFETPKHTSFRIQHGKPTRGGLYFTVRVFQTKSAMHNWAKTGPNPRSVGRNWSGMCSTWGSRRSKEIGEILLWEKRLSGEIVSHECTHALFGLLWRYKCAAPNPLKRNCGPNSREEWCCSVVGNMVRAIYDQIYKRKIIKDQS